jgi:hypothetical protein
MTPTETAVAEAEVTEVGKPSSGEMLEWYAR